MSENQPEPDEDGTNHLTASDEKDFWTGRSVLVTGAGGFIASHLVEVLLTAGAKVRAFARYNSRQDTGLLRLLPPKLLANCEIVLGDLRDVEAVDQACEGIDTVFHLGALISIPYSYIHPREVIETNINGTLNVLLGARRHGIRKVIHTSTSEVYGTALFTPINEQHPLQGQSPYSASKIGADKIVQSFYCAFDLPVSTIRPFNTYGPRQSARAVIPTIITQALTQDEIRLGSLEPRRDFTFVTDTVDAFLRIASSPKTTAQEINVGSGADISVGDLVSRIVELIGREVRIVCETERIRPEHSEVGRLLADARKADELSGWRPRIGFDEGLQLTIDWIKNHLDFYRVGRYEV